MQNPRLGNLDTQRVPAAGAWRDAMVLACIAACAAIMALLIPVVSAHRDARPSVSHPRLFPFFYQTNTDAPEDLATAVDFPRHFRKSWYRVNRPLVPGIVAAVRGCAMPVVRAVLPRRAMTARWSGHDAVTVLATYAAWILVNILCTFAAAWILARVAAAWLGPTSGLVTGAIILTTPVVILGMREVSHGAIELLVIAASIGFWHRVLTREIQWHWTAALSLGMGVLFLGKLAVSTFAAGALICLVSRRRSSLAVILPCAAAPTVAWIALTRALGIPYVFSDVSNYSSTLHGLVASSPVMEVLARMQFAGTWIGALWECTGPAHLPLAVIGLAAVWRAGRQRLLAAAAVFALCDAAFYATLLRAHAVYALHTMVFFLAAVAFGTAVTAEVAAAGCRCGARVKTAAVVAIVVVCQLTVNLVSLPRYAG